MAAVCGIYDEVVGREGYKGIEKIKYSTISRCKDSMFFIFVVAIASVDVFFPHGMNQEIISQIGFT